MNLPRHPLRVNVGFLLNAPVGYSRDIHFEFPIVQLEQDFRVTEFNGLLRVSRTPQGILAQCDFNGYTEVECVRCLSPFPQFLHTVFSELYAFNRRSLTESNLLFPENGNIELEPLVREYLILEIPISPVCRPDCKGLCPVCGENLNLRLCEHSILPSEV